MFFKVYQLPFFFKCTQCEIQSDGWRKSLEKMPPFTRIHSRVSLLKEKIPYLEKKIQITRVAIVLLREYFKKRFPYYLLRRIS